MKFSHSLFVLCFVFSGWVQAEGQYYLLAKPAVTGSASQPGQTGLAVNLRWDRLEGNLPDDVQSLHLERDGQPLGDLWLPDDSMSVADIEDMYQQPGQQQRLMQTLTLLKEIELAEGRDFEPDQFATVLQQRLQNPEHDYWSLFAARQNFNIARAALQAYQDTDVTADTSYEYTLYATSSAEPATTVILGRAMVNTANAHQLLAVRDLQQLTSDNCDTTIDHYSIVLDWLPPGTTVTDQVANNIQLAGYEIYRSENNLALNVTTPELRDLAAEAATLSHDARGEMVFNGLERVNRSLLLLDGDNDPTSPEFIEDMESLQLAGMVPGDRRAYYVVGRDFSGHYGETAAVIGQVPNQFKPLAPWGVITSNRQGAQPGIRLSWETVSYENFQTEYPRRFICNPDIASTIGLIEYADSEQACSTVAIARVDVTGYRLYRFENALQARGFRDSDGDGVSNSDEISSNMECDPGRQPADAIDYSVPLTTTTVGSRLSFLDAGAGLVQGNFYHYRIASRTADGKFSEARGPYRELYPDTTPPALPTYEITRETSVSCCTVQPLDVAQSEWEFIDAIGLHDTLSLADLDTQTNPLAMNQFGLWSSELCDDAGSSISDFWGTGKPRRLIYPGQFNDDSVKGETNEPVYCEVDLPETMNLCKSGSWQLAEAQCDSTETVVEGDFGASPVTLNIHTSDDDSCLDYYSVIAGRQVLIETSCGTPTPSDLVIENDAGLMCGYVMARDSSNNRSEPVYVPCNTVQTDDGPLSPPQILSLVPQDEQLDFSWRSPLQPTSATLIEITSDVGDDDSQLLSFPANNQEQGFVFAEVTAIHTLVGARDQWCIRAMAVGLAAENQNAKRSDWSGKLCRTRRENGLNETEYLPWPTIQPLDEGAPLTVELAADYVSDLQGEDVEDLPVMIYLSGFDNLFLEQDAGGVGLCVGYDEYDPDNPDQHPLLARNFQCRNAGKHIINNGVDSSFMVYRQARTPSGETGSWVQVSPLIESIYWAPYNDKATGVVFNVLSDPYFAMYRHTYSELQNGERWHLGYVDRYPHIAGYDYRYQTVYFSEQHAIKEWRLSDWVHIAESANE